MDTLASQPAIVESFLELRQSFAANWIELWSKPANPFLLALMPVAERAGVELKDVSFSAGAANLEDVSLNLSIPRMRAALRLGLSSATFHVQDPNWAEAAQFIQLFEDLASQIRTVASSTPNSQEGVLAIHISSGRAGILSATKRLVQQDILGAGEFGLIRYREDSSIYVDRSAKYRGGVFVRLQRTFAGVQSLPEIAIALLQDQKEAMGLLGIHEMSRDQEGEMA